jgi:hypothetical protein
VAPRSQTRPQRRTPMAVRPGHRPPVRPAPVVSAPRPPSTDDRAFAAAMRRAGLALAATALVWLALSWLGGQLAWAARWRGLVDLAALAGFAFSLYLTYGAWRLRRPKRD